MYILPYTLSCFTNVHLRWYPALSLGTLLMIQKSDQTLRGVSNSFFGYECCMCRRHWYVWPLGSCGQYFEEMHEKYLIIIHDHAIRPETIVLLWSKVLTTNLQLPRRVTHGFTNIQMEPPRPQVCLTTEHWHFR